MYKGINDIPTYNWWQLNETLDLDFLLVNGGKEKIVNNQITPNQEYALLERFQLIRAEFFDKIALDEAVEDLLLKKYKLQEYRCEILEENDPDYYRTLYEILERKIESLESTTANSGTTNLDIKAALEESQHHYIDTRIMPIAEFHATFDRYKEKVRVSNSQAARGKGVN